MVPIAYPYLILKKLDGSLVFNKGSLFDIPEDAITSQSKNYYRQISQSGWTLCPTGYAVYSKKIEVDVFLVVPGLKIHGFSTKRGKINGLNIVTSKQKVEEHIDKAEEWLSSQKEENNEKNNMLIHEIRNINAQITQVADVILEGELSENYNGQILTIKNLSKLMSLRMDLRDFEENESLVGQNIKVSVYNSLYKMKKCFENSKNCKGNPININGNVSGKIRGPKGFDLVSYLLFDNAAKYTIEGEHIIIDISENTEEIFFKITSAGPKIHADECDKIFLKGYRGKEANKFDGSGIGLFFLKKLVVNEFNGSIAIEQGPSPVRENVQSYYTSFSCTFPKC